MNINDQPRCRWYNQHRYDGIGEVEHCQDCGAPRESDLKRLATDQIPEYAK